MGILKDINDTLKDVKNIAKELSFKSDTIRGTSLAKMSSAATLQFPIIVSRSINNDTAQAVSKAMERQYATFVQIVISLNPYLDLQKDKDMSGYLKNIHQNNPTPIDLLESCTNVYSDEAYGLHMLMSLNEGCNGQILASNKEQMFSVEDHLNPIKINDIYKPASITLSVAESSLDYFCKKNNIITEALEDDIDNAKDQFELNKIKAKEDYKRSNTKEIEHLLNSNINNEKFNHELKKAEAEFRARTVVKLSDNDVKKSNELVPTTLSLTMQIKDGKSFGGVSNFVIGVKGLLHPVNSNDMISNLLDGYKSGNKFFNFIRWTTGEISFLKDLIFNIDEIKDDVVNKYSKEKSHWWTTLKRRKTLSKAKAAFSGGRKNILPNASIVCSMEEVMEIKDVYGVDLMDVKHVKKLMDRYFLLGFAIVDDSQELCYFIFDGENNYQAISYKGLEKENNSKNDFKDIYKMINSGRI